MTDTKQRQTLGLQEVVQQLQKEYGKCLELDHRAGRKQLTGFLKAQFDLKRKEASELMSILEENRSLRYMPPVELEEELFRDPRRVAEVVTSPSLRELSLLTAARLSDKAHWLIGE